jgi:hypothetical protein
MNGHAEHRCMLCQRPNPNAESAGPPIEWGVSTDKAGEVFGVICPGCIAGELLSMAVGGIHQRVNR